jgi:hypothetical protein
MPRYVHLGINPLGAATPGDEPRNWTSALESVLTQYGDMYRYAAQNYVLFTDADLAHLSTQIRALPGFQAVYILLVELPGLDPLKCNGWMDPRFWKWLKGDHTPF